jgi:hypothetical protein
MIRGSTKIFLETLAAIALTVIVGAGFVAWRLATGPITIDSITPYVETALGDPATGRRVSIGASSLIWDETEHAIEVRADRVSVFDATDQAVMMVPEITVRFHLTALVRGIFVPRAITVIRPAVTVIRTADGGWQFSAVPDTDPSPPAAGGQPGLALDLIERSLSQLDRFRLVDARLVIDDRRAAAVWVFPRMSAALQQVGHELVADGSLELDVDGQPVPLRASARLDDAFNLIEAGLTVDDLVPAKIARRLVELRDFTALDLPLSGTVRFDQPAPGADADAGPNIHFSVMGAAGQIVRPELAGGALAVTSLTARGHYRPVRGDLTLDALTVSLATAAITLTGSGHDLNGRAAVEGTLGIGDLPLDDLRKYWPPELAPNPRRWMLANLTQGVIRDATAHFAAHRGAQGIELDGLDGGLTVEGARVRYLRPQPPIEQVSGQVKFDAQHFDIAVTGGRLRGINIDSGQITITGLAEHDQQMAIEVAQSGPLSDLLAVLDLPPFGYVSRFGYAPQAITGDLSGHLSVKFPLIDRLALDDVALRATASLQGLRVPKAVRDFDLTDGKFDLNLDKQGMGLIGEARVGGVPAKLSWTENFEHVAPFRRRYDVASTLTDAYRRALGIDGGNYVAGPLGLTMTYTDPTAGPSSLVGRVDLAAASMKIDDLGWAKPAGQPAAVKFDARLTDGRLTSLEHADWSGGGLSMRSNGLFDAEGRLARLEIPEIKVGATDLAGQVNWQGERLDVALNGRSLDASALFSGDDPGSKPPRAMTVSARLDRVLVGPGRQFDKVELRADSDGTRWRQAAISGAVGTGRMQLALTPRAGGRDLAITADDAGAVLRAFGLTDDMRGGKLRIEGRYDDVGPLDKLQAKVAIDDYRIVRAPLLARLLAVTSVAGIPDLVNGEGIGFQDLSMQVVKQPGRLEIADGRASGRAMGLTVQGTIQGADDTADLKGTIVPINSVNRLFESIPLIGDIVTGKGGGLFAFTYAVKGPLDNPSVSVNPLSVLAPGFVRNLFHWLPSAPQSGTPQSGAPPPATSTSQ